jgi:hypothetical protein
LYISILYGYSMEVVWIYFEFSGTIANFVVWISPFFQWMTDSCCVNDIYHWKILWKLWSFERRRSVPEAPFSQRMASLQMSELCLYFSSSSISFTPKHLVDFFTKPYCQGLGADYNIFVLLFSSLLSCEMWLTSRLHQLKMLWKPQTTSR